MDHQYEEQKRRARSSRHGLTNLTETQKGRWRTVAMLGPIITPRAFDERTLSIPVTKIVAPGDSKVVPGEGICGGELVICFELIFPTTLSLDQKKKIKALGM